MLKTPSTQFPLEYVFKLCLKQHFDWNINFFCHFPLPFPYCPPLSALFTNWKRARSNYPPTPLCIYKCPWKSSSKASLDMKLEEGKWINSSEIMGASQIEGVGPLSGWNISTLMYYEGKVGGWGIVLHDWRPSGRWSLHINRGWVPYIFICLCCFDLK